MRNLPLDRQTAKALKEKGKSLKKKDAETKDSESDPKKNYKPKTTSALVLSMEFDEKHQRMVGTNGKEKFYILNHLDVSDGETWNCEILPTGEAYARNQVTVEEEKTEEPAAPVIAAPAPKAAAKPASNDRRIAKLEKENADLKEKLKEKNKALAESNRENGRMKKTLATVDTLKAQNKMQKQSITQFKAQIASLEKNQKVKDFSKVVEERDGYKARAENLQEQVDRLRELLALYENGTKRSSVTTYLTGETGIHCNLLKETVYTVYFSPAKKTLRFISDENGMVPCNNGDVTIPALRTFTGFEKIRSLEATMEGDDVVISLS